MEQSALLGKRRQSEVPEWSGEFWTDGEHGYISVHIDDKRTHRPPDKYWRFVRAYASFEEPAHVFIYRKVCEDCPCRLNLSG